MVSGTARSIFKLWYRGAPADDFPESGWDKIMSLNVKALFYLTIALVNRSRSEEDTHKVNRLVPLLEKSARAYMPSRVINIASVAGLMSTDPTVTESGGLSEVGNGAYSCTLILCLMLNGIDQGTRRTFEGSVHPAVPPTSLAVRTEEHPGELYLSVSNSTYYHDSTSRTDIIVNAVVCSHPECPASESRKASTTS